LVSYEVYLGRVLTDRKFSKLTIEKRFGVENSLQVSKTKTNKQKTR